MQRVRFVDATPLPGFIFPSPVVKYPYMIGGETDAGRVLSLDRKYAKEILNIIGMRQDLSTKGCFAKAWICSPERRWKRSGRKGITGELDLSVL